MRRLAYMTSIVLFAVGDKPFEDTSAYVFISP